ncbi:MAG: tetratricopeptide repeat protein [Anaerolineae bacterium]|nr:tetratricopeptide repeat protein [Anaerolineae bacterium]
MLREDNGFVLVGNTTAALDIDQSDELSDDGLVALAIYSPTAIAQLMPGLEDATTPRAIVDTLLEQGDVNGEIQEGTLNDFPFVYVEIQDVQMRLQGIEAAVAVYDSPSGLVVVAIQTGDQLTDYQAEYDLIINSIVSGTVSAPTATPRPAAVGGTSVTGELTTADPALYYSVNLNEGDVVTIELAAAETSLDTLLAMYAPGDFERGNTAAVENDDSGDADFGNFNSRIADFTVTETGEWIISAGSFGGLGTGAFTLTIRGSESAYNLGPWAGDAPPVAQDPTPTATQPPQIAIGGASIAGELTTAEPQQQFAVELAEGDVITVEMVADSDDLDTIVRLYAPGDFERSRTATIENDDSLDADFGVRNSRIEDFAVTESGTWVIEASSFARIGTGTYTITVSGSGSYSIVPLGDQPIAPRETETPVAVGGSSIVGDLVRGATAQSFTVELTEGDRVTIEVASENNSFDTLLRVYAPGDFESGRDATVENDDSGDIDFGNLNSRIEDFRVSESGTWVIEVTSFSGTATGTFTLTVRGDETYVLAPLGDLPAPTPRPGDTGGSSVDGSLTRSAAAQPFTVELTDGDRVTIEVSSPDFDTLVRLYAPGDFERGRRFEVQNDDSGDSDFGSLNSRIEDFRVNETGMWVIEVTSFSGTATGAFTLTVRGDGEYNLNAGGVEAPEPLAVAATLSGSLSDRAPAQQFAIDLTEGELVTIEVAADLNAFDTLLRLYAPDDFERGRDATIENDDSGDSNFGNLNSRIANFEVTETGTWVIEVTSFSGTATGAYTLTVRGDGSYALTPLNSDLPVQQVTPTPVPPTELPPVLTGDDVLVYNEAVTGTINRTNRDVAWRFAGAAGDLVTITMVAEDVNELDPRVFLYTADAFAVDGVELAENDDSQDADFGVRNSRIADLTLPVTGEYVLVATCFVACDGDYTLLIEADATTIVEPTPPPVTTGDELRQWASSATATTEYTADAWSAMQASGAPDTTECADIRTAWASSDSRGVDSLTLTYAQAVVPTQINIYQTLGPGSITGVQVVTVDGDVIDLPNSVDPPGNTPCPGVFTVDVTGVTPLVSGVIVNLDQSIGQGWNEIDAVELVGLGTGDAPVSIEPRTDVTAVLEQAQAAIDAEEWDTAVALYTTALEIDPENGDAYFFRGYAYYFLGSNEDALSDFNNALQFGATDTAWVYNVRGLTYDLLGEYDLALADFDAAIELAPNYEAAIQNRGYVFGVRLGDWKKYTDQYRILVDLDPSNSDYYNGVGWGLVQQRRYREALEELNTALELNPDNSSALDSRAWAYLGIEDYVNAEADFRAAIELGEIYSYYGLAELFHAQGNDDEALVNLRTYLSEAGADAAPEALALQETLR